MSQPADPVQGYLREIHVLLRDGEVTTLDVTSNWGFAPRGRQKGEDMLRLLREWLPSGDQ